MPKIVWKYHGQKYEMEKRVWHGMRSRCHNPKNHAYYRYGGRGIFMCDEWRNNFDQFYEDMGPKPQGFDLDRIDNDKGYSKENCRWVPRIENCRNTRNTVKVQVGDQLLKIHEIAELAGQKESTIAYRLKKSFSVERLLSKDSYPKQARRAEVKHGTYSEYQRFNCRCELCKEAASIYKRAGYKRRQLAKTSNACIVSGNCA
jgi:hypothetical protein